MIRLADRPFLKLAAAAVLVAALGLAACGRKGPLDPPPASVAPPGQATTQPDGQPAPDKGPTPARKSIFLDWLLD